MVTAPDLGLAPLLDWDDFYRRFRSEWRQGEHVSMVGPTGLGKSTLGLRLIELREFVVVAGTKPKDATLDGLTRKRHRPRYKLRRSFTDRPHPTLEPRVLLWPKFARRSGENMGDVVARQADVIGNMLDDVFDEGCWCVYIDELNYVCKQLGLANMLTLIWQQGRSMKVSLVGATQRPAHVPLELYSQATHVFLWRHNDKRDLDRIGDIAAAGDVDPATIRLLVGRLPKYQFLYVNTRTGEMLRSQVQM